MDPLEKLTVKKDSTLLLALSLKEMGREVFLLFEEDLILGESLRVYDFKGRLNEKTYYIDHFEVGREEMIPLQGNIRIHLRLDPPFDTRYLSYLWLLRALEDRGLVETISGAFGILAHNEKLYPLHYKESIPTFVGTSPGGFYRFCHSLMEEGRKAVVIKPLNLYQGLGVEKISLDRGEKELRAHFEMRIQKTVAPHMAQPFLEEIYEGEVRSIFVGSREIGTILKRPPSGSFLTNVARGASFEAATLTDNQRQLCGRISRDLAKDGVEWIAFDLIGPHPSEVNITCPGLLVETSCALGENLGRRVASYLGESP